MATSTEPDASPPRRAARRTPFLLRAGWGVGLLAGAVLLIATWYLREVVLLAFAGVLLAVLIRTPAEWIARRTRLGARVAVVLVTVGTLALLVGTFVLYGPAIAQQARELRSQLPQSVARIEDRMRETTWGRNILAAAPRPAEVVQADSATVQRATRAVRSTVSAIGGAAILLFLGIVLALSPATYVDGVIRLVRPQRRARAREILDRLAHTLRWWLLGRLISMTVIGVSTGIGLKLMGVPLAGVLALIAALLTFVPNIGPIISAIPAILLGLAQGPQVALGVAALYAAIQFVESFFLEPIVDRKTIYLPPALTIVAQLSMGLVAGILGVAVATPLVAAIVVLVQALYVEDALGG